MFLGLSIYWQSIMFYEKQHYILDLDTLPSFCNLDSNYNSSEDVVTRLWESITKKSWFGSRQGQEIFVSSETSLSPQVIFILFFLQVKQR